MPAICTWIRGTRTHVPLHTKEFAEDTLTEVGHKCILLGAKSLAMTTLDLFNDPNLVKESIEEFKQVSPVRSAEILSRIRQERK